MSNDIVFQAAVSRGLERIAADLARVARTPG